jgi:hypothetical protein
MPFRARTETPAHVTDWSDFDELALVEELLPEWGKWNVEPIHDGDLLGWRAELLGDGVVYMVHVECAAEPSEHVPRSFDWVVGASEHRPKSLAHHKAVEATFAASVIVSLVAAAVAFFRFDGRWSALGALLLTFVFMLAVVMPRVVRRVAPSPKPSSVPSSRLETLLEHVRKALHASSTFVDVEETRSQD